MNSEAAEQLLLGTALQESDLRATVQDGGGPALGYFQMEPNTHNDIWANYLAFHADLAAKVRSLASVAAGTPEARILVTNHRYAAAMTRVHYLRVSAPLPAAGDVMAMANYWKDHTTRLAAPAVPSSLSASGTASRSPDCFPRSPDTNAPRHGRA